MTTMYMPIILKDPAFCLGCPMEQDGKPKCKAGFKREFARLISERVAVKSYGLNMFLSPHGMEGNEHEEERTGWKVLRPQACILLHDAATPPLKGTLVRPAVKCKPKEKNATKSGVQDAGPNVHAIIENLIKDTLSEEKDK